MYVETLEDEERNKKCINKNLGRRSEREKRRHKETFEEVKEKRKGIRNVGGRINK